MVVFLFLLYSFGPAEKANQPRDGEEGEQTRLNELLDHGGMFESCRWSRFRRSEERFAFATSEIRVGLKLPALDTRGAALTNH